MPLTPVVPAPAEPAFGVPTALPDPAAVPAPVFWANELKAPVKLMAAASASVVRVFDIGRSPGWGTDANGANDLPFHAITGPHRTLNGSCPVDNPTLSLCAALRAPAACYRRKDATAPKPQPFIPYSRLP
jgi:hypothetical protein